MKRLKLTDEEVKLLLEMKDRCLNGGQYVDENAKKKFNMLCHLEDFQVGYYNLLQDLNKLKDFIKKERTEHFYPSPMVYDEILDEVKKIESKW